MVALEFSPFQKRMVQISIACLGMAIVAAFCFGVFVLLREVLSAFSHVIWPLAVAGIAALLLRPWVNRLAARLGGERRWLAVVIIFAASGSVGLGFLVLGVPTLLRETLSLVDAAPQFFSTLHDTLVEQYPGLMNRLGGAVDLRRAGDKLLEVVSSMQWLSVSAPALERLQSGLGDVASTLTGVAIIPVYLYFFMLGTAHPVELLESHLSFLKTQARDDVTFLVREFVDCMVVFFRGQILIGALMGTMLAVGFMLCGLNFGLVFGFAIGILNIIPYLGTILGLSVVLPVAMFQTGGGATLVGLTVGVFAAVQIIEGYVLTPRIMGSATGLHPLVIIIAIFFWGSALGGILGMVFAIPLTAFGVVAWRLLRRRVLTPLLADSEDPGDRSSPP